MNEFIDHRSELPYTVYSRGRKFMNYLLWYPFITLLAVFRPLGMWIFKRCNHTEQIRRFSRSTKSLELMYLWDGHSDVDGRFGNLMARFWENHVINAAAVRNRLALVRYELRQALLRIHEQCPTLKPRVLGLGCGSARGVLEVLADMCDKGIECEVTIVDPYRTAIDHYSQLADNMNIVDVSFVRERPDEYVKNCNRRWYDVVEMVGLLDYFEEKDAVEFINDIFDLMKSGGFFMTCNVQANMEQFFLERIVNWNRMVYRTPEQLLDCLNDARFTTETCRMVQAISEPLGVHVMALVWKN